MNNEARAFVLVFASLPRQISPLEDPSGSLEDLHQSRSAQEELHPGGYFPGEKKTIKTSWWLKQPLWKICSSQIGNHFPRDAGWTFQKFLKFHHLENQRFYHQNGLDTVTSWPWLFAVGDRTTQLHCDYNNLELQTTSFKWMDIWWFPIDWVIFRFQPLIFRVCTNIFQRVLFES